MSAMTIADGLKYVVFLKERTEILKRKVRDFDCTKESTRVLQTNDDGTVVTQVTEHTMNAK